MYLNCISLQVLLFLTGIWTTNIHDAIDGHCEPLMGAAYHNIHHLTCGHNYVSILLILNDVGHGHAFIFDWLAYPPNINN